MNCEYLIVYGFRYLSAFSDYLCACGLLSSGGEDCRLRRAEVLGLDSPESLQWVIRNPIAFLKADPIVQRGGHIVI